MCHTTSLSKKYMTFGNSQRPAGPFRGPVVSQGVMRTGDSLPETNSKFAPENRPSQRKCIFQPLIFRQRYQGGYQNCRARIRSWTINGCQLLVGYMSYINKTLLSTHPSNDLWPPTNSFQWTTLRFRASNSKVFAKILGHLKWCFSPSQKSPSPKGISGWGMNLQKKLPSRERSHIPRNIIDSKAPTERGYVIVPSKAIRKLQLHMFPFFLGSKKRLPHGTYLHS